VAGSTKDLSTTHGFALFDTSLVGAFLMISLTFDYPFPNKKAQRQGLRSPPLGFQLVVKSSCQKW
jgi:hypothetical protein